MDERGKFVKQWYERSQRAEDDFEEFVFLWLSMVVIAKALQSNNGKLKKNYKDGADDGIYINDYFSDLDNSRKISHIFKKSETGKNLATRKAEDGSYVVGLPEQKKFNDKFDNTINTKSLFTQLNKHFSCKSPMNDQLFSKAVGSALKAIRNNLFHGGKLYESGSDRELLALATPILKQLVIDGARDHVHVRLEEFK